MVRVKNAIYVDGSKRDRMPKKIELIKDELSKISAAKRRMEYSTDAKEIKKCLHIIEKSNQEIKKLKNNNISHKKLKRSVKKYNKDVLKQLILESIKNECENSICVENYAIKFSAKNGQVHSIFQELVREGVLHNKSRHFAHDTSRNPIFPMDISGWGSNYYGIKSKN